jgi:hypothetical protein
MVLQYPIKNNIFFVKIIFYLLEEQEFLLFDLSKYEMNYVMIQVKQKNFLILFVQDNLKNKIENFSRKKNFYHFLYLENLLVILIPN